MPAGMCFDHLRQERRRRQTGRGYTDEKDEIHVGILPPFAKKDNVGGRRQKIAGAGD
jgi:hypothetical protein